MSTAQGPGVGLCGGAMRSFAAANAACIRFAPAQNAQNLIAYADSRLAAREQAQPEYQLRDSVQVTLSDRAASTMSGTSRSLRTDRRSAGWAQRVLRPRVTRYARLGHHCPVRVLRPPRITKCSSTRLPRTPSSQLAGREPLALGHKLIEHAVDGVVHPSIETIDFSARPRDRPGHDLAMGGSGRLRIDVR